MSEARWITADVFDGLASLPDGSVDLVMSSPPFLAVRSYLPADHPDKGREIGGEASPGAFIDTLLRVVAECGRVLAPHGSLVFELGDTYAGSGGAGGDYQADGLREGQPAFKGSASVGRVGRVGLDRHEDGFTGRSSHGASGGPGWPLAKSKCLIPEAFAVALAYGINPLTGQPSPAGRWRVRNMIAWCRTNPPVGALGDKFRPAHSELIVACRNTDRYFDDIPTRRPSSDNTHNRIARNGTPRTDLPSQQRDGNWDTLPATNTDPAAGAPLLDWWVINNTGFAGPHYATYPEELCKPVIASMCPERVCRTCGHPSRRVTGEATLASYRASTRPQTRRAVALADSCGLTDAHIRAVISCGVGYAGSKAAVTNTGVGHNAPEVQRLADEARAVLGGYYREFCLSGERDNSATTWTDCGHNTWRRGHVLDPFAGSGTTLAAATGAGRDATGIDLDPRNLQHARNRLGMFLADEVTA